MNTLNVDIAIHGAGIAGLWVLGRLKRLGYNVVLLEKNEIGSGQTLAAQGIIHSGLKYAFAGKINSLAQSISQMPERWRACLSGTGELDLTDARIATEAQQLLIPSGFMGGLMKLVTAKTLPGVTDVPAQDWPAPLQTSGFKGSVVNMNELVLDIPSVIRALATPYQSDIKPAAHPVNAKIHIFTAAQGNQETAKTAGHDQYLKTQARPLLMAMMKPAPFPLYAHLVGRSEKPVASITTHTARDGTLIWYIGGGVAERAKDSNPANLFKDTAKALRTYMPELNLSDVQWAALPIDRVEATSATTKGVKGWMPDTPTIHEAENHLYCWPTKLTFAPMLADMIIEKIQTRGITPAASSSPPHEGSAVDYAAPPWDKAVWTTIKSTT